MQNGINNMSLVNQDTNPARNSVGKDNPVNKSDAAKERLGQDFDNFLLLLTTQLQHLDPTQPLDTNQLTQQIASLSTVEQQISTNKNLEKLIELNNSTQINNAVNYIGRYVETDGNAGIYDGDAAYFIYELPAGVKTAEVTLTDATGNIVFRGTGSTKTGRNLVVWDGVNSTTGQEATPGLYRMIVTAKDNSGKAVAATTATVGRVTSVDLVEGEMSLSVGPISVPLNKVKSISAQPQG